MTSYSQGGLLEGLKVMSFLGIAGSQVKLESKGCGTRLGVSQTSRDNKQCSRHKMAGQVFYGHRGTTYAGTSLKHVELGELLIPYSISTSSRQVDSIKATSRHHSPPLPPRESSRESCDGLFDAINYMYNIVVSKQAIGVKTRPTGLTTGSR